MSAFISVMETVMAFSHQRRFTGIVTVAHMESDILSVLSSMHGITDVFIIR